DEEGLTPSRKVLLDTSVIIDGRIADISQVGFIMGPMVVPRFVLQELQHIADSADTLRRNRGRRGIEILNRLQKESRVPVHITDMDAADVDAVDEKLIALAKEMGCAILTNDYNLNRIAELQGVVVLNINELANAVKTVFLPGEDMEIRIIQEGRELGQGVGYLDDGTMVVVEGGRRYINDTITATVTKVLQTSAGRMIFARPANDNN
ncbi:MAG TPA: PIN domain-containing protein, partial [Aggregatilineales bacterium]|nr:PIN domain-containing protein [Aggregatilineales bacterium]